MAMRNLVTCIRIEEAQKDLFGDIQKLVDFIKDCSYNSENELVANGLKVIRIVMRSSEN
eukprot:CAMPEP_0116887838 /NCGR_PEP_ID=MMETSP0463-20121206/22530_1 /TAXON_ID=181622 /ORGANISM="Strombidinopsis sp, Strain SopsisLIS2011" /LENGTH=58 /DNA_ID=CAMNT_0004551343 /DNA_START=158 /DNA_END=331 /DNA_ORIENTATION=+